MLFHDRFPGILILMAALTLIAATGTAETRTSVAVDKEMDTLVTTEWLSQHLDDPDLVVLDCTVHVLPKEGGGFTPVSGRADYEEGHIPSAGFADLMGDLAAADSEADRITYIDFLADALREAVGGRHVGFGDGVYRSLDGGKSFQNMGLRETEHVAKILIANASWISRAHSACCGRGMNPVRWRSRRDPP